MINLKKRKYFYYTLQDIILIDDEQLNIFSWKGMAKQFGVNFNGRTASKAFFDELSENNKNFQIYVDYDLQEENGIEVIRKLKMLGFHNVYLATGHHETIHSNIAQEGKEFPVQGRNP